MFLQFWHRAAVDTGKAGPGFTALNRSGLARAGKDFGGPASEAELEAISRAFAPGVEMSMGIGADGVEVHACYGYLLDPSYGRRPTVPMAGHQPAHRSVRQGSRGILRRGALGGARSRGTRFPGLHQALAAEGGGLLGEDWGDPGRAWPGSEDPPDAGRRPVPRVDPPVLDARAAAAGAEPRRQPRRRDQTAPPRRPGMAVRVTRAAGRARTPAS
jgi:hypothetical protein